MAVMEAIVLVLGIGIAVGATVVQGEIDRACSSNEAQVGGLLGHPDAQKCQTYPGYAQMGLFAGIGLAVVGGGGLVLGSRRG